MPSTVQLRLVGYVTTLVIHCYTFYDVLARLAVTTKDPVVADFATLQDKFITIWTFIFQIAYVILGIACDLLNSGVGSEKRLGNWMNWSRETLFSAIIWPTSLLVPALFWPLYLYNNRLVFPIFIDQILSTFNNQVLHSYVVLVVLWELTFLERRLRNHKLNLSMLISYMLFYLYVLFTNYAERGSFIYPILNNLYGTAYFPLLFVLVTIIMISSYLVQWPLSRLIWKTGNESNNVGKKRN